MRSCGWCRPVKGARVRLLWMGDDPDPVLPGTLGTVVFVDDAGTVHVDWDSGRKLGVVPDSDGFEEV